MGKLRMAKPLLTMAQPRLQPAQAKRKTKDAYYNSGDYAVLALACLDRDGWRCVVCGDHATVCDHLISRRQGGADTLDNVRSLCRDCDSRLREAWDGRRAEPSAVLEAIRRGLTSRPKQSPESVERRRRHLLSQAKRAARDDSGGGWGIA